MSEPILAVALPTRGERIAVYARLTVNDPWVQVEAVIGQEMADKYAKELRYNDVEREEAIDDARGVDWHDMEKAIIPPKVVP